MVKAQETFLKRSAFVVFISFLLIVVVDHKRRMKHVSGIRAGKKTV